MSLAAKKGGRAVPAMNVTPLVDVVLVLLIIFMVVVPMMEASPQITLPRMEHPDRDAKSKTDPFMLSITSEGELYLDKEHLSPSALEPRLREKNRASPNRRIVLRADERVRYAKIRPLLKTCQEIGFPGVSIRVNVPQAQAEQE